MQAPDANALTASQAIAACLSRFKTIAVVGLSPKPERTSHEVAAVMQRAGFRIIPIHPGAAGGTILGEKVYANLTEAAKDHPIELVDVFRNSEDVPPVVDEAIAVGAKAVWLQLGIVHDAAMAKARSAGLITVQNRCIKVEWARRSA
jgi:predicted CoA-binding protein